MLLEMRHICKDYPQGKDVTVLDDGSEWVCYSELGLR